jgi:hypothetical protein
MRLKLTLNGRVLFSVLLALVLTAALLLLAGCAAGDGDPAEGEPDAAARQTAAPATPVEAPTIAPSATVPPTATASPPPTATLEPTYTPEPTATPMPTPTPAPTLPSTAFVNGVPVERIVVLSDEVSENVRQIYANGRARGRDPFAFSKLGDSLIATPSFLAMFETHPFNLGPYDHLSPVLEYYAGSFERYGVALRPGLHAWGVFDPLWANKDWCQANENLLDCEIRLNNPSVMLVLLGTNAVGYPEGFEFNMRKVVQTIVDAGIIPQVPLWDYDLLAETLPNRGLQEDGIHLTVFPENDYELPEAYQLGHGAHNLSALMMLDAIRQIVSG